MGTLENLDRIYADIGKRLESDRTNSWRIILIASPH